MMKVEDQKYVVDYSPNSTTVTFTGTLRLRNSSEHDSIEELLNRAFNQNPAVITLDIQPLKFINSSGINVLSRFVLKTRGQTTTKVTIHGTKQVPWQPKTVKNLQQLSPKLNLVWD
jgi:hypothetical protein